MSPHPDTPKDSADDFQSFYLRNWLPMVRFAALLTGDNTHAEDATQEAFLSTHKKWVSFGADDAPKAYLRQAVINQCRQLSRRNVTLLRKAPLIVAKTTSTGPLEIVGPQHDMWRAIAQLPARMREVLVLRFYEDCDVHTTAAVLGVSEGTVKSTTSKALKKLRTTFSEGE